MLHYAEIQKSVLKYVVYKIKLRHHSMSKKTEENQTADTYRRILSFCNESSDDYFFLLKITSGELYFFGKIAQYYNILQHNAEFCTLEDWYNIVYPPDLPDLQKELQMIADGIQQIHNKEYRIINKAGNIVWINCRGKTVLDKSGNPDLFIGRISDTILQSKTDQLTGTFAMDSLKEETDAILKSGTHGYLLLVGVDDLKAINLKNGREYGDETLKRVAEALEYAVNGKYRIYRSDGDCFAVNAINSDCLEIQNIFSLLQKRIKAYCTVSGGCVPFQTYKVPDADTLYQYAENTLDNAKLNGKNTLLFFSAQDYEKALATLQLQEELRNSIKNNFSGFSLCYQPQVEITTYQLHGAEALLRYRSPVKGSIPPSICVPILEQTRLICPIGMWILKTALNQCKIWRKTVPDFRISVNMSYIQLLEDGITEKVLNAVFNSGVPASALTIELTESMQLFDYPAINTIFHQWKQAGIQISIDDFGTGYSSLSRLKEMEINEIKIDRIFISSIQNSLYNYRLLSNMLELADSNQITVCCEGIETEGELAVLEELRPALLQGFLFSQPCDTATFEETYINSSSEAFISRKKREQELRSKFNEPEYSEVISWTEDEIGKIILETSNDIYYLRDIDTYELYYLNSAGQKLFGLKDFKGKKCYKVLRGKNTPCEFCANSIHQPEEFCIWNFKNEYCGQSFIFKSSLFKYKGKTLLFGILFNGSKHEIISKQVRDRIRFTETAVTNISRLVSCTDMPQSIQQALQLLGEFYQADHAYFFELNEEYKHTWTNTYEWCPNGISPQKDALQEVPREILARWMTLFNQNKSIIVLNVDEMKQSHPLEWQMLSSLNITNLMAAPICIAEKTVAFVGVDNQHISIQDDSMLQIIAAFLLIRLRQQRNEYRYKKLLAEKPEEILRLTGVGLWSLCIDQQNKYYTLTADDTMQKILGITDTLSPEECYQFWYSRISEGYYHYVNEAVSRMITSHNVVQIEYTWRHPEMGEVLVQCTGIRTDDIDSKICLQGYHRIISNIDRQSPVPEKQTYDIFEFNEPNKTIFFHTDRILLSGNKLHESDFPACWIHNGIVHKQFVTIFQETFDHVRLKKDFKIPKIMLKSKQGTYEWFTLSFQHLSLEVQDLDTVIIKIEQAGSPLSLQ